MSARRAVELFAGVGGFRLGLERTGGWETVWSNQWEPGKKTQHASSCYVSHFGPKGHVCDDIGAIDKTAIPDHDLLVGGFPCQDYSVATTQAKGIQGKKGVLWWQIYETVKAKRPETILLENVDRLLKSPTSQRGRDFAIILWCLNDLGYAVEWRVLNAADYGFPQRRRRVFIFGVRLDSAYGKAYSECLDYHRWLRRDGFFAQPFPVVSDANMVLIPPNPDVRLPKKIQDVSDRFDTPFENSGVMVRGAVWTLKLKPSPRDSTKKLVLGDILERSAAPQYYIPRESLPEWEYLKGAKNEPRKTKGGFEYTYDEGPLPFPDPLDRPARTILTGEGGPSPSRFKHVVEDPVTGKLRRLTPVEVERLNGFDDGWTATMPEGWRYFTMGNALVVGLVEIMGARINEVLGPTKKRPDTVSSRPKKAPALKKKST